MITLVDKNLREVSNGVSGDDTREALQYLEIDKGCATACDSQILVTTPVQDEDNTLERHYVKGDIVKSVKDFKKGVSGVMECSNGNIRIDDKAGSRTIKNTWNGCEYPDTSRVFPDPSLVTTEICLGAAALKKLLSCFNKDDFITFKIVDNKTPIVVESNVKFGVIMPCKPE